MSDQENSNKNGMPVKTFLLIFALAIVALGLSSLAFLSSKTETQTQEASKITETPILTNPIQTSLTISSSPTKLATISSYSTDILIDTGKDNVNKVQLELLFDPRILTKVDITPGDFFQNPQVLLKNVDDINGRISFALGVQDGETGILGKGILAKLSFTAIQKNATISVSLLPKTQVMADGFSQSVLKTTIGGLFELNITPKATNSGK